MSVIQENCLKSITLNLKRQYYYRKMIKITKGRRLCFQTLIGPRRLKDCYIPPNFDGEIMDKCFIRVLFLYKVLQRPLISCFAPSKCCWLATALFNNTLQLLSLSAMGSYSTRSK